jgi:hypothetical protein
VKAIWSGSVSLRGAVSTASGSADESHSRQDEAGAAGVHLSAVLQEQRRCVWVHGLLGADEMTFWFYTRSVFAGDRRGVAWTGRAGGGLGDSARLPRRHRHVHPSSRSYRAFSVHFSSEFFSLCELVMMMVEACVQCGWQCVADSAAVGGEVCGEASGRSNSD